MLIRFNFEMVILIFQKLVAALIEPAVFGVEVVLSRVKYNIIQSIDLNSRKSLFS